MATGGFKLSLAGAKGKPGLKAPLEKSAKRRRLALDDEEPEDIGAKQEITGWDAAEGGAVDANAPKEVPQGPRVIAAQPNRNWREEARKRQNAQNGTAPVENGNGEKAEKMGEPKLAFGLTTFDKKEAQTEGEPEPMDTDSEAEPEDTRTEDEKLQAAALDALVNGKAADFTVIPISEEEAFQNDIRDAPSAPTLAAYEATPIEGFGAALLRGMGWKDGQSLRKDGKPLPPPKEIKRRPALLGIGAKPESAVGVELGEWGGAKKGQHKKMAVQYNPLTLRNKKTGEKLTEEELKQRLEKQKEADERSARNSTFVGDDEDEDERKRQKRRERKERDRRDDDYDSERRKDKSRRDREDDYSDRDRRRDKKHSEYEDSDRDRRRDKKYRDDDYDDRRRDRHREKDSRRRDRSRSPYDDDRREKRRERDRRERSVDSKDHRRDKRRERSRSRERDDRYKKSRDYDREDGRDDRRSKYKDDKYSRR